MEKTKSEKLLWICMDGREAFDNSPELLSKHADKLGIKHRILYTEAAEIIDGRLFYGKVEVVEKPDYVLMRSIQPLFNYYFDTIRGVRVINSLATLANSCNKLRCHRILEKHGIPQPKYMHSTEQISFNEIKNVLGSPFIAKNRFGNSGSQVYLVSNETEFEDVLKKESIKDLLFQEFIKESSGKDIRTIIIGGKFVAAFKRETKNDFRANLRQGALPRYCEVPKEIAQRSEKIAKILKGDILSVDYLIRDNEYLLCETNVIPGFINSVFPGERQYPEIIMDYVASVMKEEVK